MALRIEGLCAFQSISFPVAKAFALMDDGWLLTNRDKSRKKTSTGAMTMAYLLTVCFVSAAKCFTRIATLFAMVMFLRYSLSASSKKDVYL